MAETDELFRLLDEVLGFRAEDAVPIESAVDQAIAKLRAERSARGAAPALAPEVRQALVRTFRAHVEGLVNDAILHGKGMLDRPMVDDGIERIVAHYEVRA